jgi:hypothetical protein
MFHGPASTCAAVPPCPLPPTGACCLGNATCTTDWEGGCIAQGGKYQGDNSQCANASCPWFQVMPMLAHGSSNIWPFSQTPGTTMHQVYASTLFGDLTGNQPLTVEQIAFAPTGTGTFTGSLVIRLGYTNAIPGAGPASGGLQVPDIGGGGSPNAIGAMHDFYNAHTVFTPSNLDPNDFHFILPGSHFEYDPSQGNLLLEWYITDLSGGIAISNAPGGPQASRAYHRHNGTTQTLTAQATRTEFVFRTGPLCYANCDNSTTEPVLNVEDFVCFINEFAQGIVLPTAQQITHYANCDNSTTEPVLNVEDFICFINEFSQGCP